MKRVILLFFLLIAVHTLSSQTDAPVEIITHQVKMGETIRMISKRYLVPPADIYKLNRFAVDGIRAGMVLHIPVPVKSSATSDVNAVEVPPPAAEIYHSVAKGESFSSIAKHYQISETQLREANPEFSSGKLPAGATLMIPSEGGLLPSNEGATTQKKPGEKSRSR